MKIPSLHILTVVSILLIGTAPSQAERIVGVDNNDGLLYDLDPDTGEVSNFIELSYRLGSGSTTISAGARHPVTGDFYTIINGNPGILAIVDTSTGASTPIGTVGGYNSPGGIPSIAFGPGTVLYAISGGPGDPGSIYIVDPATGTPSATGWVTKGEGGHAIEYNPDDGMIYHFYEESGMIGLEKIDPATGLATDVTLSGAMYGSSNGVAYASGGLFYVIENSSSELYGVSSGGVSTLIGEITDSSGVDIKSLIYKSDALFAFNAASPGSLIEIDPADASVVGSVALGPVPVSRDAQSIVRDPITDNHYILTNADFPATGQALAQVDINTGAILSQVTLSHDTLSEIAFDSSGELYGIGGDARGASNPLSGGQMATIDMGTGVVTGLVWPTSRYESQDHALAYNPDDGLFYHFYTDGFNQLLETVDPINSGAVNQVAILLAGRNRDAAAAVYTDEGNFLFVSTQTALTRVTTAGGVTVVNVDFDEPFFPNGLTTAPDLPLPDESVTISGNGLRDQLLKKMRKIRKKLRIAKRKMQVAKAKRFSSKLKKLKKQLRALG